MLALRVSACDTVDKGRGIWGTECGCNAYCHAVTFLHQVATNKSQLQGAESAPNSKHWFPSTTAVFSYAIGSRTLSANEQFFVGSQTVVILLQTTQIISEVCFVTDHVTYAISNKEEGAGKRCSECDQYPNLSVGDDRVGGQLRGDKEWRN